MMLIGNDGEWVPVEFVQGESYEVFDVYDESAMMILHRCY